MFEVTVHASTSNLGSGFDAVGMALSLSNTYTFETHGSTLLQGFDPAYGTEDNLVLTAYRKALEALSHDPSGYPVMIKETSRSIPVSRGLGSSSACIVAGVTGAFLITGEPLDKAKIMRIATMIEGHPDNVAPVVHGGLVSVTMAGGVPLVLNHPVSPKLHFACLVPNFEIRTNVARSALPERYSREDVVHAISRAVILPRAFMDGDLGLIGTVFDDVIHEPYRYPLIKGSETMIEKVKKTGAVVAISGSGPTLFVVGTKPLVLSEDDPAWSLIHVRSVHDGFHTKRL
jgi:homoserine kinase